MLLATKSSYSHGALKASLAVNSSSPNTADVPLVTISVTMLPVTLLLLVGSVNCTWSCSVSLHLLAVVGSEVGTESLSH